MPMFEAVPVENPSDLAAQCKALYSVVGVYVKVPSPSDVTKFTKVSTASVA